MPAAGHTLPLVLIAAKCGHRCIAAALDARAVLRRET